MTVDWHSLTRLPLKAEVYDTESYFREGWGHVTHALGERTGEVLHRTALLVVKPDGVRAGKLAGVVPFLADAGFEVVTVEWLSYSRHIWHALWRYQLTSATLDRLAVNEIVLDGPALMLLLHDRRPDVVPATVRLAGLKGTADVARQRPGSLRHMLAQPNRVLSFVHVADEPADIVRELGLLLDRPRRARVLSALAGGRLSEADATTLQAALDEAAREARPVDVAGALERVTATVRATHTSKPARERALRHLDGMAAGRRIPWRDFADALDELGLALDRWDAALLGTSYIVYDEPGRSKLIENVDAELWRHDPAQWA